MFQRLVTSTVKQGALYVISMASEYPSAAKIGMTPDTGYSELEPYRRLGLRSGHSMEVYQNAISVCS